MQDALRELEHLSKLATADLTKRFGKLYRLVSHIQLLTIAGERVRQNTGGRGWNRRSNAEHIDPDLLRQLAGALLYNTIPRQFVGHTFPKVNRTAWTWHSVYSGPNRTGCRGKS